MKSIVFRSVFMCLLVFLSKGIRAADLKQVEAHFSDSEIAQIGEEKVVINILARSVKEWDTYVKRKLADTPFAGYTGEDFALGRLQAPDAFAPENRNRSVKDAIELMKEFEISEDPRAVSSWPYRALAMNLPAFEAHADFQRFVTALGTTERAIGLKKLKRIVEAGVSLSAALKAHLIDRLRMEKTFYNVEIVQILEQENVNLKDLEDVIISRLISIEIFRPAAKAAEQLVKLLDHKKIRGLQPSDLAPMMAYLESRFGADKVGAGLTARNTQSFRGRLLLLGYCEDVATRDAYFKKIATLLKSEPSSDFALLELVERMTQTMSPPPSNDCKNTISAASPTSNDDFFEN